MLMMYLENPADRIIASKTMKSPDYKMWIYNVPSSETYNALQKPFSKKEEEI